MAAAARLFETLRGDSRDQRGSFEWLSARRVRAEIREWTGVRPQLEVAWSPTRARSRMSIWWLLRHLLSIGLVHAAILVTVYFLLLLGDALFTSYAIVLHDAVFVSYVAQPRLVAAHGLRIKAAIAFVVG